ncbi:transcriptional regulator with XRE-family HTH domain [Stackebrandtia albiflava]|uniref:Transcriptional regulator with XRE-family HTH domain n=1 Tax=Stackebrandtia albiflava TaxID=406432 RepID=A0A562V9W8_9ACTN|nr:Scr1 family TA system antitoxin-like transcriptional regulator [Stackebrandtia albiflava]TWJ14655.1 transcriptional regulator with XRE-family HTH domain [Stackebrandtia albiflava]
MTSQPGFTQWLLASVLERLRLDAGMTCGDAAMAIGVARQTVSRWEAGLHRIPASAVKNLCEVYGATTEETNELYSMTLRPKDSIGNVWERARQNRTWRAIIVAESLARHIYNVEPLYVPGLLQTPEYWWHLNITSPDPKAASENGFAFRRERQRTVFQRSEPPLMTFLVGEPAMRYMLSLEGVSESQTARLRAANRYGNVDIRVFSHPVESAFAVFESGSRVRGTFVCVDQIDGTRYTDNREAVASHMRMYRHLVADAVPLDQYLIQRQS